jgi:hypothetical protein
MYFGNRTLLCHYLGEMADLLRSPIETFRTAPVQLLAMSGNLGGTAINAFLAIETNSTTYSVLEWGAAAMTLGGGIVFGFLAKEKINLRDRLEATPDKHGFNKRIFNKTTTAYCTRQAARVACENYDCLSDYESLCRENSQVAEFAWLPHI